MIRGAASPGGSTSTPARGATPTLRRGSRSASSWRRGGGAAGCRSCSQRPDPGVLSPGSPTDEAAEALPPPLPSPPLPCPPPPTRRAVERGERGHRPFPQGGGIAHPHGPLEWQPGGGGPGGRCDPPPPTLPPPPSPAASVARPPPPHPLPAQPVSRRQACPPSANGSGWVCTACMAGRYAQSSGQPSSPPRAACEPQDRPSNQIKSNQIKSPPPTSPPYPPYPPLPPR